MKKEKNPDKVEFSSSLKRKWNLKVQKFAKKYPKEIFFGGIGILFLSIMFTAYQIYFFEDNVQRQKEAVIHVKTNNIGETLKEQNNQNNGVMKSLKGIQSVGNPISIYNKMEMVESLNNKVRDIMKKEHKTEKDSLDLIKIYNTLKELSYE